MFNHVHKLCRDLLGRISAVWAVPLGEPVAHAKQAEGDDFGVSTRLKRAYRLSFFDNPLKIARVVFFVQDDFFGERSGEMKLFSKKNDHGRRAVSGNSRLVLDGTA